MSILLDALRKSENSQKPAEPPTIHGNDPQFQESGSVKSSYVMALIAVALLLTGWLLWKQYHPEQVGYRPPVDLPAGRSASKVPEVAGTKKQQPATAPQKTMDTASGRPRTPVESYEMSSAEKAAADAERKAMEAAATSSGRTATSNQSRNEPLKPARPEPDSRTVQAPVKTVTDGSAGRPPAADGTVAAADSGSRGKSPGSSADNYRSPEPAPIGYWELPDSVRNGVPEIRFSVLVYAEQAQDRFVLINGVRLIEGDELKPGLVVEHIRRDGVVFSYQLYRFFVKR